MAFKQNINHVLPGEAGKASVPGRPDRELENNIQYVKDLIDSALLGQSLFLRDVTVANDVVVGSPVYWNAINARFEKALAGAENDPATDTLKATLASDVIGIVYVKANATLADLLVLGSAVLDLSNVVDDTSITDGRYYLSAAEAGKLVAQRPPATVSVLFKWGSRVTVVPDMKDFLNDHLHFSFDLTALPAGTHSDPGAGNPHEITAADATAPGWLPANHASVVANRPAGAKFAYNLAAHPELDRVWPPIPVSAAGITWDKGADAVGGTRIPTGSTGLVILNSDGIWWMSDCYADVPWPADLDTSVTSSSSSIAGECPRDEQMRLTLDFIRMTFATDRSVVTSLQSDTPTLLKVVNCDGDDATTGALKLQLLLEFLINDSGATGDVVPKSFNEDTLQFEAGPVVEAILEGSNVTLSSSRETDEEGTTLYQGRVTVAADFDPLGRELPVDIFRLDDSRERFNGIVLYLAFLATQTSSVQAMIRVPPVGLPTTPKIKLRVLLLGTTNGTPPAIVLTSTIAARPTVPTALPTGTTTHTFNVPAIGAITSDQYFEIESEEITVAAGDTLFFELERAGSDGYTGEIGLIRLGAIVQSGT